MRLIQALPSIRLTIVAEKFGTDTTTAGAAGVWGPYKLSGTPDHMVHRWGKDTWEHLLDLVHSPEADASGVSTTYCYSLHMEPEPDPFWADITSGFSRISPQELQRFSSHINPRHKVVPGADGGGGHGSEPAFVDGYSFNTVVCEGRLYMRWLSDRIRSAGGTFVQRRVTDVQSLALEMAPDLLIDCAGLGAAPLFDDSANCYPIRGQIMRVRAPWVRQAVFGHFLDDDNTYYIIPNREWVVLGGTGQVGNSDLTVSLSDAERMFDRCCQLLPSLRGAHVLDSWVGLRPGRKQLRLERDVEGEAAGRFGGACVVHNYGHGGSGLTLAWGTAGDAVQLALEALEGR